MRRRRLLTALFVIGLLYAAVVSVLRSEVVGERLCAEARRRIPELTEGKLDVRIGHCQLEPVELGVELRDVAVSVPGTQEPLLQADRAEVRMRLLQAVFGRLHVARVELERPRIHVDLSHLESKPEEEKPKKKSARCEIDEVLQRFALDKLALTDGSATLVLPQGRVLELNQVGVTARSSRGVSSVRVSQAGGRVRWEGGELPLEKLLVAAQLDANASTLELSRLELLGGQLSVLAKGTARSLCEPDLDLEANAGVPLDQLVGLLDPPGFQAKGYVAVNATVRGKLDAISAHAELDVNDLAMVIQEHNHVDPKDLTASIDVEGGKLYLRQLYWPLLDGYGKITGELTLADNFPFSAVAEGHNVPFGELLNRLPLKHPWVDANVQVKGKITGHALPTPTFSGPMATDWTDFFVRTRAWDAPARPGDTVIHVAREHIENEINFTPERVKLTKIHMTGEKTDLYADGTLSTDPEKGLDLNVDVRSLDLSETGGSVASLPWSGVAQAKAHITGPYGRQTIEADIGIKDFNMTIVHLGDVSGGLHFDPSMILGFKDVVALKGRTTYKGHGLLDFSHKVTEGGGFVSVENGRVEDLLEVLRDVHWGFDMFRGQMTGLVSGTINLKKGEIMAPTSDFDLQFSEMNVWQRPMGSGHFRMHTQDGDSITIPPVTFDGALGTLTFGGWQRVGADLHYTLSLKDVSVPVATAPELVSWDMTGTLSGSMAITGPSQQVDLRGEIFGNDLTMFGYPVGQGHVQLRGTGASMAIDGPVGDDVTMHMRMRWENQLPMEAHFAFNVTDLFKYVPTSAQWNDFGGQIKGTLDVAGLMKDSSQYVMHYAFPTMVFTKGDYTEENAEPVAIDYVGDTYDFKSVHFKGRREGERVADTDFTLGGTMAGDDKKLNLEIKGTLDAKLLEAFYSWIESSSGRFDVAAAVGGNWDHPTVVGSVDLSRGRLKLRDSNLFADGLSGRIDFSQSSVQIPEIRGTLNRGPAWVSGAVSLRKFRPSTYDLQLHMDNGIFHFSDWPEFTASGELDYVGPADDPAVTGHVDINRFIYSQDLTLDRVLENLKNKKLEARIYTKEEHLYRYQDLKVSLNGDVRVNTNLVKTQLKGELDVLGDNARPILRGEIEGMEGGRAYFRGNEFDIDELLVNFRDTERITPEFDIHARSVVRDYKVLLHIFGTPDNYQVVPTSDPGLPEADLLTLLTLGYTSQDRGASNSALAGAGLVGEAIYSATGLEDQVKRFIPQNKVLKDPTLRFTTSYSQRTGSMQPTAQIEGKLLTDKLRLRLQQPVIAGGRGTKAQLEYKFDDNVSVQSQLDGDNTDYSFPDLGLDLRYHKELK